MTCAVDRHIVTLDGRWGRRQVHYRRAGDGPLLLMLHQSPQSSRELEPLMAEWGAGFTVIAPDSPGYGLSDPLGVTEAELGDFADATVEFLDALGARRFGIYGFHTGGMIGIAIAHRHPDRVTAVTCNGVAVPTAAELESILADYLPPFEPRWDGGHLAWLWARIREQTIFFPWHNRTQSGRMNFPMPSPARQQVSVLEFLRAADHYHVAYRAAFVFRAQDIVPVLRVPALITAADPDPLCPHLQRLGSDMPANVSVRPVATATEALESCLAHVSSAPGDGVDEPVATQSVPGRPWRQIVPTSKGSLHVYQAGPPDGVPVLLLHDAGGSSASLAPLVSALGAHRRVICPDLPGHGESEGQLGADGATLADCAGVAMELLAALGVAHADVAGVGAGALVGLEILRTAESRVRQMILLNVWAPADAQKSAWLQQGLPSLAPEWHGGHLLCAWHMVRDGRLFFPWFQRDSAGIRWEEPELDDRRVQVEVTELLKADGAWQRLLRDSLEFPLRAQLQRASSRSVPVLTAASRPWQDMTRALAQDLGVPYQPLGDRLSESAAELAAILAT